MDGLDRLEAIEAIRSLKARYFRPMDTKRWDDPAQAFTADMQVVITDGKVYAHTYAAALRNSLGHSVSCHQNLGGEVEVTGLIPPGRSRRCRMLSSGKTVTVTFTPLRPDVE